MCVKMREKNECLLLDRFLPWAFPKWANLRAVLRCFYTSGAVNWQCQPSFISDTGSSPVGIRAFYCWFASIEISFASSAVA